MGFDFFHLIRDWLNHFVLLAHDDIWQVQFGVGRYL